MTKIALLAAASALALSAGGATAAPGPALSSKGFDVHATRLTIARVGLKTLYAQNDDDAGLAVFSDAPDDQGADDFVVPAGHTWKIKEVDVTGVYYNGSGPAASENVYFYRDSNGLPGNLKGQFLNVSGTANGNGSFAITLPSAMKLKPGHYWVSVQANCAFETCGEWGWELRSVQANNPAAWQEPNCGSCTCPHWETLQYCFGGSPPPDFMFAIKGRDSALEP